MATLSADSNLTDLSASSNKEPAGSAGSLSANNQTPQQRRLSTLLKLCIFVTGLTGIVAEYMMATLASYLLGNTVLQWALIISTMLFAMGVGSRLSRRIEGNLLQWFIATEFLLSLLCGVSAIVVYSISTWIESLELVIYSLSFSIGLLIGLEIPLAARLNEVFDELRVNIAAVMEKDYLGALFGGLLFSFVALPWLGLTYTPVMLGLLNLSIAIVLFAQFHRQLKHRKSLAAAALAVPVLLIGSALIAEPLLLWGEQKKYLDRVVYSEQTPYQRIVITRWKNDHWLYLNGNQQFSTYDEERYHEPLVHPAMQLAANHQRVLVLGGGDGIAVKEILKYPEVENITLVDLDPAMTKLASTHPMVRRANGDALKDPKVHIVHADARTFIEENTELWDVIIIDLPDPKSVDLARLYSREFYASCKAHLATGGSLITQAGSPYFSKQAFLSILATVRDTGLVALPLHNHVPTMGEWGWVIASKAPNWTSADLKRALSELEIESVNTRHLNQEALQRLILFSKGELDDLQHVRVTHALDLAVYEYYRDGRWDLH